MLQAAGRSPPIPPRTITLLAAAEATCGTQQELPVGRRAETIEPEQGKLVATVHLTRRELLATMGEKLDADAERRRNATEIPSDLAGAAGLPLCDRTARYADGLGELVLGPAQFLAGGTDAGADFFGCAHSNNIGQLT